MRVFQHFVTHAAQEFLRNKKVLRTFFTTLAASCGAPQLSRNDFYFFRNAGGELDQSELRLHSTNVCCPVERCSSCGTAAAVRCAAAA